MMKKIFLAFMFIILLFVGSQTVSAEKFTWIYSTDTMTIYIDTSSIRTLRPGVKTVWGFTRYTDGTYDSSLFAYDSQTRESTILALIKHDANGYVTETINVPRSYWEAHWAPIEPGTIDDNIYSYLFPY